MKTPPALSGWVVSLTVPHEAARSPTRREASVRVANVFMSPGRYDAALEGRHWPLGVEGSIREDYISSVRWEPEGPAWQYVMLDKMPASIDPTLIEENLKRTPAERLQALQAMVDMAEEIRRAREDRVPKAR